MQTIFEKMGSTYRREGDYLLPDIEAPESPQIGIWGQRRFEDFDDCYSTQKIDLHRKWYHTRTKHPQVSLDGIQEKLEEEHEGLDWEAPDESQNLETSVVDVAAGQAFLQTLDHKDAMILTLRNHGFTLEEIADELGYTNHTGVLKRIKKIGAAYQAFAGVDIGF